MSEFRQNPITKQWVLIAPNRAKKPDDFKTVSVMHGEPELSPACVFCPGNEHLNPAIVQWPAKGDWQIRIIPNKFPALQKTKAYAHREFYVSRAGYGENEVVITRKHNEQIALQSVSLVEQRHHLLIERVKALSQDPRIAYVEIIHNHGRDAGATLIHPHSQIWATPFVPPHLHAEILSCYHYYQDKASCIYCDIVAEEMKVKDRLVYESEHFAVICPYSSRAPFETWIIPKQHRARYENSTDEEIKHLAYVLKVTLAQLYTKLNDPPFNIYIHTMPFKRTHQHLTTEESAYHWHLTIFPRLTIWAGFEFGTGIPVNPMPPEEAAEFLR